MYFYGSNTAVFVPFCTEYTKNTPAQAQISYGSLKCGPSFCTAVLLLATLPKADIVPSFKGRKPAFRELHITELLFAVNNADLVWV